jgi:hypothetical protein
MDDYSVESLDQAVNSAYGKKKSFKNDETGVKGMSWVSARINGVVHFFLAGGAQRWKVGGGLEDKNNILAWVP